MSGCKRGQGGIPNPDSPERERGATSPDLWLTGIRIPPRGATIIDCPHFCCCCSPQTSYCLVLCILLSFFASHLTTFCLALRILVPCFSPLDTTCCLVLHVLLPRFSPLFPTLCLFLRICRYPSSYHMLPCAQHPSFLFPPSSYRALA